MLNEVKTLFIFLRDDGISIQFPDGQSAGYRPDGTRQVIVGQDYTLFPEKIILSDRRSGSVGSDS